MRYLMFVCVDPSAEPFDPALDDTKEWASSHDRNGSRILGHRLAHIDKAKTVRVRKGQLLVTDGCQQSGRAATACRARRRS